MAKDTKSTHRYLSIVSYTGGQIDSSMKSTVVITPEQFLFAYEEDGLGFQFVETSVPYNSKFSSEGLMQFFNVDNEEAVLDAIYNLELHGFRTSDNEANQYQFVQLLTGQQVNTAQSVDPRSVFK